MIIEETGVASQFFDVASHSDTIGEETGVAFKFFHVASHRHITVDGTGVASKLFGVASHRDSLHGNDKKEALEVEQLEVCNRHVKATRDAYEYIKRAVGTFIENPCTRMHTRCWYQFLRDLQHVRREHFL